LLRIQACIDPENPPDAWLCCHQGQRCSVSTHDSSIFPGEETIISHAVIVTQTSQHGPHGGGAASILIVNDVMEDTFAAHRAAREPALDCFVLLHCSNMPTAKRRHYGGGRTYGRRR
jgi:hypothetical protein